MQGPKPCTRPFAAGLELNPYKVPDFAVVAVLDDTGKLSLGVPDDDSGSDRQRDVKL